MHHLRLLSAKYLDKGQVVFAEKLTIIHSAREGTMSLSRYALHASLIQSRKLWKKDASGCCAGSGSF